MTETRDDDHIHEKLSAFADGALDAAQSLEVVEYLAAHPEAVGWLRDHQRLTAAARRVLKGTGEVPASLTAKITGLRLEAEVQRAVGDAGGMRSGSWWRAHWWQGIAALILLAAGVWIGQERARPVADEPTKYGERGEAVVIPASVVSHASQVHADCSRLAEALHSAAFPQSQGKLAADIEADLKSAHPYPDLGSMGYRFTGAGPCGDPLSNAVHLLYHSERPGSIATVSVFVQEYTGQFPLKEGEVYTVSVAASPFPMLAWRTERVIYFLIADNARTEREALRVIRGTDAGFVRAEGTGLPILF
jgi:anti-sigma factor RsiW